MLKKVVSIGILLEHTTFAITEERSFQYLEKGPSDFTPSRSLSPLASVPICVVTN